MRKLSSRKKGRGSWPYFGFSQELWLVWSPNTLTWVFGMCWLVQPFGQATGAWGHVVVCAVISLNGTGRLQCWHDTRRALQSCCRWWTKSSPRIFSPQPLVQSCSTKSQLASWSFKKMKSKWKQKWFAFNLGNRLGGIFIPFQHFWAIHSKPFEQIKLMFNKY